MWKSFESWEWMEKFFHGAGLRHACNAYGDDRRVVRVHLGGEATDDHAEEDEVGVFVDEMDWADDGDMDGAGAGAGVVHDRDDYPYGSDRQGAADLWKYICHVHEQIDRLPTRQASHEEFDREFFDAISLVLDQCQDEEPDGMEDWRNRAPEDASRLESIKWALFLHSVRENFFGMVQNHCIWVCHQHHRQRVTNISSLEWIAPEAGPTALRYDSDEKFWFPEQNAAERIARDAVRCSLSLFDMEYQGSQPVGDLGYCFVTIAIGMEVKVSKVRVLNDPEDDGGPRYSMVGIGPELPCEFFGPSGSAIRLHWSSNGMQALRGLVRVVCRRAFDNHHELRAAVRRDTAVDRMVTVYPAWGCGKTLARDEGGVVKGRPCQFKSSLHPFSNHVPPVRLARYFKEEIARMPGLSQEQKRQEMANGLYTLLLPTAEGPEEECSGSYPVLNTYEGIYRACPAPNSVLRDGSKEFMEMARGICGLDGSSHETRVKQLSDYVSSFQEGLWRWHDACPSSPALRVEDCCMYRARRQRPCISVEWLQGVVQEKVTSRVQLLMNVPLRHHVVFSRRFEFEETVLNTIPLLTMLMRRGEMQMCAVGRVHPSLIDHLAMVVGMVQHVVFGRDRLASAMKKYFNVSPQALCLRTMLVEYGFICGLPVSFFFGGSNGLLGTPLGTMRHDSLRHLASHAGLLSFLPQKMITECIRSAQRTNTSKRWQMLGCVLSDILHFLDITLWPTLMLELLSINFLELLCVHHDEFWDGCRACDQWRSHPWVQDAGLVEGDQSG
jgi:hypothetical protein